MLNNEQKMLNGLKEVKLEVDMLKVPRDTNFTKWLEKYLVEDKQVMEPTAYNDMTNLERFVEKKRLGMDRPLDAFELMLKANGIKASGPKTSRIKNFFESTTQRILWPEFISQTIYAKMMEKDLVAILIPNTEVIEGWEYTKMFLEDTALTRKMGAIAPGEKVPETKIKVAEYSSNVKKYGRRLKYTYEQIANKTLGMFTSMVLQRIADQLKLDRTARAIEVLTSGDGGLDGLPSANIVETENTTLINKDDIIAFASSTDAQYQINQFVATTIQMRKWWSVLSTFSNPESQKKEIGVPIPNGNRWDGDNLTSDYLLGLDPSKAALWVTNDDAIMEESWKLIDTQEAETVITVRGDVTIIDRYAISALDINHS